MLGRGTPYLAAAMVGAVAITGCSKSHRPEGPAPRSTVVAQSAPTLNHATPTASGTGRNTTATSAPVLPVLAYELSASQLSLLNRAVMQLTSSCMARFGYQYGRTLPTSTAPPDPMDRRYGVMSLAAAQTYGYHLSAEDGGSNPEASGSSGTDGNLSAAEQAVLSGSNSAGGNVPAGGCHGEAQQKLSAGAGDSQTQEAKALGIVNQINQDSYTHSQTEPSVVAAFKAWSSCMTGKGYSFTSPNDAINSADLSQPKPSSAEIRLAIADMTCKTATNLIKIWESTETSLQNSGIQKNVQVLADTKSRNDERVKKAAEAVGSSPP
ncbi:hypothetical protein BH10ACT8_BH10ACT8_23390 [soil metagenome]